ncbi:MAG: metalloregulator ArsR/SmtB family transcription factor [Chloroflexota bacterium]|nr:metalloregulator ArsR/SmtB family transcription factor [Chloroflexota bacterium]
MDEENQRILELQAEMLSVLANPKRLMILNLLNDQEKTVGEIASELEISIQNTSQHLRSMKDRGIVVSRKEGQTVYYKLTNPIFHDCCQLVRRAMVEELNKRESLFDVTK